MAIKSHSIIISILLLSCLLTNTDCKKKSNDKVSIFSSKLAESAEETYSRYTKQTNPNQITPSSEIPKQYWADKIKELKPIKVYIHRGNIVVVQKISDNTEEGKYIYMPISSYMPDNGDDGFTFTPLGDNLYDFKRILK
jgi:hypothetical protein